MNYKVLFILENFYGPMRGRLKCPVYGTQFINPRNATYSRILKHFKGTEFTLYFGETTPFIADNKNDKFDVDLDWVKKTVEYNDWFAVIPCCKKAENALKELGIEPFMNLPHPASYAWRKQMIINCIKELNEHKESSTNLN